MDAILKRIQVTAIQLLTSKKAIAAVTGIAVAWLASKGIIIPEGMQTEVVAIVIAYITGQGLADVGKEAKK